MFLKRLAHDRRGDTIVEVLIALAILGLAFSISFATANHALIVARNAEEHSEALQYLDSQVELARSDAGDDSLYNPPVSQCIDTIAGDVNYGKPIPATSINCKISSLYNLSYTYLQAKDSNNIPQDIFTFTVAWSGVGSLGAQQEQISYKIHKLTGAAAGSLTPTSPPPTLTFTSSPPSPANIYTGQSVQLTWSTTDATSCTASGSNPNGNWSGAQATSGSIPQTFGSNGIYSYGLACSGPGSPNPTSTQTVTVTVTTPPPPPPKVDCLIASLSFGFDCSKAIPAATVFAGQRIYLYWSSSNSSYCTGSGPMSSKSFLSTSTSSGGAQPSQSLFYTPTTFTLTCTSSTGVVSSPVSVQVIVNGGAQCTALQLARGQC
ncbi:MAG TPA: type II secretion system protein [Patescibacteria group bacterium]|nr:type II secretion system protein [Patescibacteria group bacterium]